MTRRVLIAGAGYVGIQLGLELAAEGHQVFGLRRQIASLPPEIEPIQGDLSDPSGWAGALPALDDVVYAAAADATERAAYQLAYVDGLARVLDAVTAGGRRLRRFVFTSSTAVYAQQGGVWVDERSPTEPGHFTGELMLETERRLLGAGVDAVVLRLGGIYGPGRTRLIEQVRAGRYAPAGDNYVNRVHRDDCAGAIRHVLELPQPERCYLVVDDEPAPQREVAAFLARRLGVQLPDHPLQPSAKRRGAPSNKRCSNRLLKSSGYRFRWPTYRDGYASLL